MCECSRNGIAVNINKGYVRTSGMKQGRQFRYEEALSVFI
jgi:hypothetical protein